MWLARLLANDEPPPVVDTAQLTDAFMEMDAVLSKVAAAVKDYMEVTGNTDIDQPWDAVRSHCYDASSVYLSLTGPDAAPTSIAVECGVETLRKSSALLSKFQIQYNKALNTGVAAIAEINTFTQQARTTAAEARAVYSALDTACMQYMSVSDAVRELDQWYAQLTAARYYSDIASSARRVIDAADRLTTVCAAAPHLADDAQHALSSVSTRISVARTRLDKIPPALSVLLKEFPAASSADLVDNKDKARELIRQATDCLGRARSAQHNSEIEESLAMTKSTRRMLKEAEELTDAVLARLDMLRDIRDDPEKLSKRAHFALRDAQMFADIHHLTGSKWRSILDFQSKRLESLKDSINTPFPDYFAYANGLNEVADFIQTVVAKMQEAT